MKKGQYKTRQREELLEYLQSVSGKHVTVNDIWKYFNANGITIGITTIYRHLEKMVDEGLVKKYLIDANTPACFEYVDSESCCQKPICFHFKCTKCGKLSHVHCDELIYTEKHILEHHKFLVDTQRTVFFGLCEECQE